MREKGTDPAVSATGTATDLGASISTPVAKAVAEAEWPDGKDGDVGIRQRRRISGTRSIGGRPRPDACLPRRFTARLAVEIPLRPPHAAPRRLRRPAAARPAAGPDHPTQR